MYVSLFGLPELHKVACFFFISATVNFWRAVSRLAVKASSEMTNTVNSTRLFTLASLLQIPLLCGDVFSNGAPRGRAEGGGRGAGNHNGDYWVT